MNEETKRTSLANQETGRTLGHGDPFHALRRQMDRLFEDFAGDLSPWSRLEVPFFGSREDGLVPTVDVKETEKEIVVTAELPGLQEKDVDLTIRDGVLSLKGEKKDESKKEGDNYYVTERRYGSFHRAFRLPDSANEDKATADFSDGVLTVTVPKKAEAVKTEKKIKIGKGK